MKSRFHVFVLAVFVFVLFVFARGVCAQTGIGPPGSHNPPPPPPAPLEQSHTFTIPLAGSPPATSFSVPQFDPRIGILRSASITVETMHEQDYAAMQLGLGRALFWFGDSPMFDNDFACFTYLQINAPSGQTVCSDLNVWELVTMKLSGFGSGKSVALVATYELDPVTMQLGGLVGSGDATFSVTRSGFVWHSATTANAFASYQRRVGATGFVVYRYQ